mmetsp:Transcript_21961/g.16303  ORF Transcript_21961/g.16303 Transcript_21961/m.16303 type:complete len:101 (-) Transcript_21961:307-609(-)
MTMTVLLPIKLSIASCTIACDCSSNDEVASSSSKICGFLMMARAIAILWRWPPESLAPPTPHCFRKPEGKQTSFLKAGLQSMEVEAPSRGEHEERNSDSN